MHTATSLLLLTQSSHIALQTHTKPGYVLARCLLWIGMLHPCKEVVIIVVLCNARTLSYE